MDKDVGLSFDSTITVEEVRKELHKPFFVTEVIKKEQAPIKHRSIKKMIRKVFNKYE